MNQITSLYLNYNTKLKELSCGSNKLSYLNLPSSLKTKLQLLSCYSNEITQLDVTDFTALYKLDCSNNHMNYLDIRTCTSLSLTQVLCGAQTTSTGGSQQLTLHYMWNQGGSFNSTDPDNANVVRMQDDTQN